MPPSRPSIPGGERALAQGRVAASNAIAAAAASSGIKRQAPTMPRSSSQPVPKKARGTLPGTEFARLRFTDAPTAAEQITPKVIHSSEIDSDSDSDSDSESDSQDEVKHRGNREVEKMAAPPPRHQVANPALAPTAATLTKGTRAVAPRASDSDSDDDSDDSLSSDGEDDKITAGTAVALVSIQFRSPLILKFFYNGGMFSLFPTSTAHVEYAQ